MANKKFSEFTLKTDSANVDFLVGFEGTDNVRIAPSNLGGGATSLNGLSDVLIDGTSSYFINIPSGLSGNPAGNLVIGNSAGNSLTTGLGNIAIGNQALSSGTVAQQNVAIGNECFPLVTGNSNVGVGYFAGKLSTAASNNTFIGNTAGQQNSQGDGNTFVGKGAGFWNTTLSNNAYIGMNSGSVLGQKNVSLGVRSLAGTFAAVSESVGIGYEAGGNNQATQVTFVGSEAGRANTAVGSISIGYQAGYSNTSGSENTNIGYKASYSNTTSSNRTSVGYGSLEFNTGSQNTAFGQFTLRGTSGASSGQYNTAVGYIAGEDITTGQTNSLFGWGAGKDITTGSNNTCIGYFAQPSSNTASNEITLGNASITALRIPGLQSGASDGDVLTFSSATGDITLQAGGGGGGASSLNGLSDVLIDTASEYVGTVPAGLSGNPQGNTTLGISAGLDLTTGLQNTLIGNLAGQNVIGQFGTTAVGYKAGSNQNAESYNTYIGNEAGRDHVGSQSVFIGGSTRVYSSGQASNGVVTVGYGAHDQKAGGFSIAVGYAAGAQASGVQSVYVGRDAGKTNVTTGMVALGYEALRASVGGNGSTALGYRAGYTNTSGSWNATMGYFAAYSNATGSRNTVLGTEAGYNNIGDDGVFIGYQAGYQAASSLNRNTMVGAYAGRDVGSTRFSNTFIGYNSGRYYNSNVNCFIGTEAGRGNSSGATGSTNTAVGSNCFQNSTTSSSVVAMGYQCLRNGANTGNNIVAIGANIHVSDTITGSNLIILGEGASASSTSASNEITLGNASIGTIRAQVTSITAISDERDKTSIETIPYGLEFVNSLQPKKFVWDHRAETDSEGNEFFSANKGKKDIGFIAQDLQSVDDDYLNLVYDENPDKLEATYGRLIPVLVQAIKELKAEVELLKNK